MTITHCSFAMQTLHSQAQELTINFESQDQTILGSKQLFFKKPFEVLEGELHDVCSQNGKCDSAILTSLFNSSDVKNSKKILNQTKKYAPDALKIFVLDVKGKSQHYLDSTISTCEGTVLDFFKGNQIGTSNKTAKQMYTLFEKPALDYIFNEGSLKSALLKKNWFSDTEITYLQETKEGIKDFCQIAEFMLNGFKLGYETNEFSAKDYISSVSNHYFKPCHTSITFYPPSYVKLYHPEAPFFKTLSNCYQVKGELDGSSKVSTIKVCASEYLI